MKPGDETPQNWQQPAPSLPQAPYQAPVDPQAIATEPHSPTLTQPVSPTPVFDQSQIDQSEPQNINIEEQESPLTDEAVESEDSADDEVLVRWQATEYIHHERTMVWYIALGVVVVAFICLALFVFNSVTFAILIPVMLVALVVYIKRPPSILNYTLSRKGLHVNDHLYAYDQFKAFGIVSHEESHSVVLLPRKRFQVSQTVYFPEEIGESLVDMFAARLPMQEVQLDAIDRLLKKLRI